MRYLVLAVVVVLAAAPLCPAELVDVTATLAPADDPDPNFFNVHGELTVYVPSLGDYLTGTDDTTSAASGTSRFQLNCTFDPVTHAVASIDSIKFLFGDDSGEDFNPAPLSFVDIDFVMEFKLGTTVVGALAISSEDFGGSTSTGLQHDFYDDPPKTNQDPALIPFVPVNGSGEFPLNTTTDPSSDMYLYLSGGTFTVDGLGGFDGQIEGVWEQWPDPSVNVDAPMPGNGTVSVGEPSIDGGVATYVVDVSIPIDTQWPVPNLGFMSAVGTLEMSGEFTRVVSTPLVGDANGDDVVDEKDASILGANWLQTNGTFTTADGDFNGDHIVNDKDAAILAAHWGDTQTGGAVPEPSTVVLLLGLALAGLAAWRRR